jgi:ubiquinol-cytochrome c reductase iron-sulfur subunit
MRRLVERLLLGFGLARGALRAGQAPPEPPPVDPSRREVGASAAAERATIALLLLAGAAFLAFAVLVAAHPQTQLLGATAGGGLLALAGAAVVAGKAVVPRETAVEERPVLGEPQVREEVVADVASIADGVTRRRLIAGAAGVAGVGLAAGVALPVSALGPSPSSLGTAPWRRGTRLVDEQRRPLDADAIEAGSFVTAFPEGADPRELGSPVVVVRVTPDSLALPPDRRGWAPEGFLAYSKICTHAGCAVSLYRAPTYEPLSSPPALVCPCHYSTFDVRRAAKVTFGPAGRPLPQLPLAIDEARHLVAGGPLSDKVGPAWWSVDPPRDV